jgi:hypothetical protein
LKSSHTRRTERKRQRRKPEFEERRKENFSMHIDEGKSPIKQQPLSTMPQNVEEKFAYRKKEIKTV